MQASDPARGASTAAPPGLTAGEATTTLSPVGRTTPSPSAARALHQPGAVVARVRGPPARAGRRRAGAAAREGEVPGHLLRGPRRVLPGPGGRAEGPGGRRAADPIGRRAAPQRGAARHRRAGDRARRPPVAHLPRLRRARPGRGRGPGGGLVVARRRRPRAPDRRLPAARSSRCSPRCRSTRGTPSPTSPTCRST